MQGQRTKPIIARTGRTVFLNRNLLLASCLALYAFFFASAFQAQAVQFMGSGPHKSVSLDHAGKKISQLAELDQSSDWENDTSDCDESELQLAKANTRPMFQQDIVPLSTHCKTQAFSPSVPLFVLFHAWKDYLV